MPPVRSRALVLHAFPYGETSRILRLLTRDFGLRSVIAKGAQRPKSRYGAALEPFSEGAAEFILREGRDLLTLSGFTLLRSRQSIGRDLAAFSGASVLAELVLRSATEEPQPQLYDILVAALDALAGDAADPVAATFAAAWSIVALLGFRPEMQRCIHCGRALAAQEASRFDPGGGGIACRACRPEGRLLPAHVRLEVDRMGETGTASEGALADARTHAALLDAFLASQVAGGRPFRSLPLFREQLR